MTVLVEAPRVNANEDNLQLIEIKVAQGESVEQGALLFVLETTKAAVEVNAPEAGVIGRLDVKIGDFVAVGSTLCEIVDENASASAAASPADSAVKEVAITAKARKAASELGIDLADVRPSNGRIGEAEVRAAASCRSEAIVAGSHGAQSAAPSASTRRAVIIGGGGHAACLIDALDGSGYEILGCTDQALPVGHHVCAGISVIGTQESLERLLAEGTRYAFIGIGGAQSSEARRAMFERAAAMGFILPPVIHPSAIVSKATRIGDGCHILAGASIGPRCTIGNNVIVNQGSIVCHDSVVQDHAHLTPGAIVAGGVSVGAMSVVGMGATVLLGVQIGAGCLIHNGAHISANVADNTIVDAQGRRHLR
ncbi:NeuD/PglB/VioB family sugar acetyltransferase [Mesorhizobium sp. B283B1A]|uniref:NeuD/PglB/VioB family sugar acetyltransferase n=1 Tax=Mesorhizobium TaxID=68287 RepID=UPI001CD14695|nr:MULTISPECIES: NeuD/PglB/VioB family sugar acetyltransferase [Mesorhizobium]MCA0049722.1 NeuD/PglB/VioB family sugar acetyltransferase [Mesorhizobium sp. B283B1A]UQS66832.1 NeuD/PglB/VioB family sugar acetyltransferase [Mesorhizobium opportunistum]